VSWYISGREQYIKLAVGNSLNLAEVRAIGGLVPLLAQPAYRGQSFSVACLTAEDHSTATLMLAAIRSHADFINQKDLEEREDAREGADAAE